MAICHWLLARNFLHRVERGPADLPIPPMAVLTGTGVLTALFLGLISPTLYSAKLIAEIALGSFCWVGLPLCLGAKAAQLKRRK